MIELYSGNLLIEEQGRRSSLDLDELRRDIRECCVSLGISDSWLADHAAWAMEDYFAVHAGENRSPPAREEIDQLISRLLYNAGYSDVATAYTRRRNPDRLVLASAVARDWDEARVRLLVARHFPLDAAMIAVLHGQLLSKLNDLGFRSVSDSLILELARHLLRQIEPQPAPHRRDTPWLFTPESWEGYLNEISRRYWHAGALKAQPVSRLNPVARVTLDLDRLATELGEGRPLTELQFWPELTLLTRGAHDLLEVMHRRIQEIRGQPVPEGAAGVLILGIPRLMQILAPARSRPAQRQSLTEEITAAVKRELPVRLAFPISVRN